MALLSHGMANFICNVRKTERGALHTYFSAVTCSLKIRVFRFVTNVFLTGMEIREFVDGKAPGLGE